MQLARPAQATLRLGAGRLRAGQVGFRPHDCGAKQRRLELGDDLPGAHLVVVVGAQAADRAGDLAADFDLDDGIERTGRRDARDDATALDLLRAHLRLLRLTRPPPPSPECEDGDGGHPDPQEAAAVGAARDLRHERSFLAEVLRIRIFMAGSSLFPGCDRSGRVAGASFPRSSHLIRRVDRIFPRPTPGL